MQLIVRNKRELPAAARKIIEHYPQNKIFAFYGNMGSGKTTIIKAICNYLGAADPVTSPTFTLVNEYRTATGNSLYHIDFYRIKKTEEAYDFGIEEYFSASSYCFMEWPELIERLLPNDTVKIYISVGPDDERILDLP